MRELKFRSWKMHYGKLRRCVFSPFGLIEYAQRHPEAPVLHNEDVNDIRDFMPNADVIEQYTGLKDKNGKEIYEGDIVKLTGKVAQNKSTIYEVVWENSLIGYVLISLEPSKSDVGYLNETEIENRYEVIGNIHENPELLKK